MSGEMLMESLQHSLECISSELVQLLFERLRHTDINVENIQQANDTMVSLLIASVTPEYKELAYTPFCISRVREESWRLQLQRIIAKVGDSNSEFDDGQDLFAQLNLATEQLSGSVQHTTSRSQVDADHQVSQIPIPIKPENQANRKEAPNRHESAKPQEVRMWENPLKQVQDTIVTQGLIVMASWKIVKGVPCSYRYLYQFLLRRAPELSSMFKSDMEKQGMKLWAMLDLIATTAHDLKSIAPALKELGKRHATYGVTPGMYDVMAGAMIEVLQVILVNEWAQEIGAAWIAVYTRLAKKMLKGAEEYSKSAPTKLREDLLRKQFSLQSPQLEAKPQSNRKKEKTTIRAEGNVDKRKFKTAMCDHWRLSRACAFGDKCMFAHGKQELRAPARDS